MKVVINFCVEDFFEDLKKIYQFAGVEAYSEFDIKGFVRKQESSTEAPNWFASTKDHYDSKATFAFLSAEKGELLLNQIKKFNSEMDCCSPIHAYMLDVEKFIDNQ